MNNIKVEVSNMLRMLCVPVHLKGYRYLRTAIIECLKDRGYVDSLTTELLPKIARKYSVSTDSVWKAMSYAVRESWRRSGGLRYINGIVYKLPKRPTNLEFLSMVIDTLELTGDLCNGEV